MLRRAAAFGRTAFLVPLALAAAPAPDLANRAAEQHAADLTRIAELRREVANERIAGIEQRIRADLDDAASSRFEILMSVLVGFFGVLITAVVIFFSFRTKEAAVAEAQRGIEDSRAQLRAMIEHARTESATARETIEEMLLGATDAAQRISAIRTETTAWALEMARRAATEMAISDQDRVALNLRSDMVGRRSGEHLSPQDLLVLVAKYLADHDWERVQTVARAMRMIPDDARLQCLGYFHQATAAHMLGRYPEAIDLFDQAITKFGDHVEVDVCLQVVRCRINRANALGALNRHEDALAEIGGVLSRLHGFAEEEARDFRWKLLINKGNALSHLGRNLEAQVPYDEVIREISNGLTTGNEQRLANAYYNKACACALDRKLRLALSCLKRCIELEKAANFKSYAHRVGEDSDFDCVRDKPQFKSFIGRHGLDIVSHEAPSDAEPEADVRTA